ncbi:cell division protein SepF [Eggerthellaceae bacterium zg-997]|nr:cell division protein SepF [Eggerthellaceae bacterium zg-997]
MAGFIPSEGDGGFLGGLRARLGFNDDAGSSARSARSSSRPSRSARGAHPADQDDFDAPSHEAEEFAEYGPDYAYADDAYDAPSSGAPATEFAPLVSNDEIRRTSGRLGRDPLRASDEAPVISANGRMLVEKPSSAHLSPRGRVERESGSRAEARSSGLNNLFSSTTPEPTAAPAPVRAAAASAAAPARSSSARSLSVLRPTAYGDVERVAKIVKGGDVVVIVLRNTPDDLARRILDFAFGVCSALEASVEHPADKVFALSRGAGLTFAETSALRKQGVL